MAASDHLKTTYNLRVEDQVNASGITRGRFLRIRNSHLIPSADDLQAMRKAFPEFDTVYSGYVDKFLEDASEVSNEALMARIERIERMLTELLQRK